MKFKKKFLLLPLIAGATALPLTSCATTTFSEVQSFALGAQIEQNMKITNPFFNNFAFFGGSDISYDSYNLYESQGYRNQIELFEDYIRRDGPYNLLIESSSNYTSGKRLVFDFTTPSYTIKDALNDFEKLTEDNKILTTVYNVDTKDVTDLGEDEFRTLLKSFIDKSLALRSNTGMVIIKSHYQTNDQNLNSKIDKNNEVIKDVIASYWNDTDKIRRINLVDHAELTKKKTQSNDSDFVTTCLTADNKLNAYGQLEMLYETISSLYTDAVQLVPKSGEETFETSYSSSFITYRQPSHTLTTGNSYVVKPAPNPTTPATTPTTTPTTAPTTPTNAAAQPANPATPTIPTDAEKVQNFQNYLKNLDSANWQFFGDSLTYAGYQTYGYKGFVEYLRWLLKNEFNRSKDHFLNEGVSSGRFGLTPAFGTGEYSFPELTFKNYPTDVLYVMMGTNEVTSTNPDQNMINNITRVYNDFKSVNPDGWLVVSTIPYFYNNASAVATMKTNIDKMNQGFKTFIQSKPDVILSDTNLALNNLVTQKMGVTAETAATSKMLTEIYVTDLLHFNTSGYIAMTKNILTSLGFDYSNSQFMEF